MTKLIKKMLASDKMRYLIAGGCTTGVNLVTFFVLRTFTTINRNSCNAIAIAMAIAFAYFANKFFVFRSKPKGFFKNLVEAVQFVAARLVSMIVEILGFSLLCDSFRMQELYAKIFVQFVVLILNYIFSKLFVFTEKKKSFKESLVDNYCYYVSFAIVALVLLIVSMTEQIAPFGGHSLTLVDSLHQYLPFFSEYRDKLLHEGSLFYTWNVALGSNFVSLSSYYLASPFNFLLLLFSKDSIVAVVCFTMCLKVALSAVTMTHFISYKDGQKRRDITVIAIAVCYALSNYMIGYFWNTMWIDCLMIFPLIILGFQRLMEQGEPKMYVLSLFYALYCNYYIGYIICAFLVLWFFVYNHKKIKAFFVHGIRFAIYSLISGGLAAFMLLPAYFGIMSTAAGDMKLPVWEWYGDIFVMFKQQLIFTSPMTNQTFDGGVNLYCGMLVVLTMFLFLFAAGIHPWTKIKYYLLLALLMVSFNSTTLNYIWHGMHDQYGIPNRFSFLYIFVLLVMADEALKHIRETHFSYVVSAMFLALSFVFVCKQHMTTQVDNVSFVVSLALVLVYAALCIMGSAKAMSKEWFYNIIGTLCVFEMIISGVYGLMDNGFADYDGHYATSPAVTKAYDRVKEMIGEEEDGFYRAEVMKYTVLDESSWHNMPSVGTFNSTVLGELVTTMGRLGFYTGANEFLYKGSTPFTNTLFDIDYLLKRPDDLNNYMFDYAESVGDVDIYKNPYPGSVAYAVSSNVKDFDRYAYVPMNAQNILAYDMTGEMGFFEQQFPDIITSSSDGDVYISNASIDFTPEHSGKNAFMLSFTVETDGDYYVNCRGNYITQIHFYINGESFAHDRYQIQVFHLGDLKAGDYVSIEYEYNDLSAEKNKASFYVSTFNEDVYRTVYDILTENMMQVDSYEDGYVKGKIYVPEGQTIFTTIPYDEGWSLKVDGKPAKYYKNLEAFIGIDVPAGEHTIELTYTPKGLKLGILISLVSMMMFMLGIYVSGRPKKSNIKEQPEQTEVESEDKLDNELEEKQFEQMENVVENESQKYSENEEKFTDSDIDQASNV